MNLTPDLGMKYVRFNIEMNKTIRIQSNISHPDTLLISI